MSREYSLTERLLIYLRKELLSMFHCPSGRRLVRQHPSYPVQTCESHSNELSWMKEGHLCLLCVSPCDLCADCTRTTPNNAQSVPTTCIIFDIRLEVICDINLHAWMLLCQSSLRRKSKIMILNENAHQNLFLFILIYWHIAIYLSVGIFMRE